LVEDRLRSSARFGAESLNGRYGEGSSRPQLLTDADLGQLPPLEWDIDGILPTGALSYLIGLRGSGKTLLALDWSCHIALGRPWYGRAVKPGPVLYVAAEVGAGVPHKIPHTCPAANEKRCEPTCVMLCGVRLFSFRAWWPSGLRQRS
jgi:hypothetical protein